MFSDRRKIYLKEALFLKSMVTQVELEEAVLRAEHDGVAYSSRAEFFRVYNGYMQQGKAALQGNDPRVAQSHYRSAMAYAMEYYADPDVGLGIAIVQLAHYGVLSTTLDAAEVALAEFKSESREKALQHHDLQSVATEARRAGFVELESRTTQLAERYRSIVARVDPNGAQRYILST